MRQPHRNGVTVPPRITGTGSGATLLVPTGPRSLPEFFRNVDDKELLPQESVSRSGGDDDRVVLSERDTSGMAEMVDRAMAMQFPLSSPVANTSWSMYMESSSVIQLTLMAS